MKFLIVGLGSMGKRRIRCLKTLGYNDKQLVGYDIREDRLKEVEKQYKIRTYSDLDKAIDTESPSAMIISVPPLVHHICVETALNNNLHFFVEASVVDTGMAELSDALNKSKLVGAPSATLLFHPAVKMIKKFVLTDELGKISNIIYHNGQYLPDWHTYENVNDFYVSNPESGGGREIVPFELTWITDIFGFPTRVCGNFRKTIDIEGAENINDTYNILLDYNSFLATVTVDVVSRCATQRLLINGDKKQLCWDWDEKCVKIFCPVKGSWEAYSYESDTAQPGYHANIGEGMYVEELKMFIAAIEGKCEFVNNFKKDHDVLKLLYAIERSDKEARYIGI